MKVHALNAASVTDPIRYRNYLWSVCGRFRASRVISYPRFPSRMFEGDAARFAKPDVFSTLPRQAQCTFCWKSVQRSANEEQIAAVEVFLHAAHGLASMDWSWVDEHGDPDGNNPHVWFPWRTWWRLYRPLTFGTDLIVVEGFRCVCGLFRSTDGTDFGVDLLLHYFAAAR